ncbi:amidohydrolase [Alcanivorax sp. S6407]|uniref:amidohydrolase n=1 Tax=Alcanivorax sp. S6407 TaxID=2926424 RepID=UPI001FF13EE4|nr:amidohydrolase [Alcanivorax sp. S6407]MCK0155169.1 amidohydrolase [Alcanivorax sp. S6407]
MKIWLGIVSVIALLVVAALAGLHRWFNPPSPAAQLFYNGTIMTMDPAQPEAPAMLVKRGEIVAFGDVDSLRDQVSRDALQVDLEGGTLMPGFIEAHGHFPGEGLSAIAVDANSPPIGDLYSIDTLLERLKLLAQRRPEGTLLAYGFDDTTVGEQRYPTREELDSVSDKRPIMVMHISGHLGVLNSAALSLMGIEETVQDPAGGFYGRDAEGRLNGLLAETAFSSVRARLLDLSAMDGWRVMRRAAQQYLSRGITFAQNGLADAANIRALGPVLRYGMLPLRLSVWPDADAQEQIGSGRLSLTPGPRGYLGSVKLVSDGSLQGFTGFLSEPYFTVPESYPEDYLGFPSLSLEALSEQVARFHCRDRQVAIHANGDAAITMSLDAVAAARAQCPKIRQQPVLIHAQMATAEQLQRMVALDVIPSFFNVHVYYWGDRHRDIFLGPERAARISPLAEAQQLGLPFTLHADSPVVPFQPLQLVWNAVHRETASGEMLGADQAIDVKRALRAVTVDAARQLGVAEEVGQLRPGMKADLVWLDRDPREFIADWKAIQVRGVWVDGVRRFPGGMSE